MKEFSCAGMLKSGLSLAMHNIRQLAILSIFIWAIDVIVLAPLTTWMLNHLGSFNGNSIVSNTGFSQWLLTPSGVIYVLFAGAVVLLTIISQATVLFWVTNKSASGEIIRSHQAMLDLVFAIPRLFRFSLDMFLTVIIGATPLALIIALVYLTLLDDYDINYYITTRPPEFFWAISLSLLCALIWIFVAVKFMLRGIFVLPIWLENEVNPYNAFRVSWRRSAGATTSLFCASLICLMIWGLARLLFEGGLYLFIGFILARVGTNYDLLIYTLSFYLVLTVSFNVSLHFVGISWLVSTWVAFYRNLSKLSISLPNKASRKSIRRANRFDIAGVLFGSKSVLLAVVILLIVSVAVSFAMFRPVPKNINTFVIAHRAGASYAPENSLSALKQTIKQGISDYAEIDVQLTQDGIVVVAHDKDLMKIADSQMQIGKTNFSDLRKIDIGRKFHPDYSGEKIATLDECLKVSKGKIPLMIEFKQNGNMGLVSETIHIIRKRKMTDMVVLMSLDLDDVRQSQMIAPKIPVGYLASFEVGDLSGLDVDFIASKNMITTPKLIHDSYERLLPIYCWTVDDPKRMLELVEMGVDGIITNDPVLANKIIAEYRKLTPAQHIMLRFRSFWKLFDRLNLWGFSFI